MITSVFPGQKRLELSRGLIERVLYSGEDGLFFLRFLETFFLLNGRRRLLAARLDGRAFLSYWLFPPDRLLKIYR